MNWKKEAENDLKAHEKRKAALRSLAEEIRELQARTYGSTAPAADAVPVQGGTSTAEGRLIAAIDELERKKGAYRATKRKVDAVERGLATLTAQQVDILDRFFIHRTRGHVQAQTMMVMEEMAELQKKLCKHARDKENRAQIAEEIADVQIMLEQMELLHDCAGLVAGFKAQKLDRLEKRLRGVDGND